MTVFPAIINLLKEKNLHSILLTGGGIIPDEDRLELEALGVGKLFPPGTASTEIAGYINDWVSKNRSF